MNSLPPKAPYGLLTREQGFVPAVVVVPRGRVVVSGTVSPSVVVGISGLAVVVSSMSAISVLLVSSGAGALAVVPA